MTITMKNIRHLSQPPSQHTLQPSILWPQGTGWRRRRNLVSIGTVVTFMPQRVGNVNAATVDLLGPNEQAFEPVRLTSRLESVARVVNAHGTGGPKDQTLAEALKTRRRAFVGQQRAFGG
jgi:hypothetical protein